MELEPAEREKSETPKELPSEPVKTAPALDSDRLSAISRRVTKIELSKEESQSAWSRSALTASFVVSLAASLVAYLAYLAWTKLRSTNP